jgi:hypothetical protein
MLASAINEGPRHNAIGLRIELFLLLEELEELPHTMPSRRCPSVSCLRRLRVETELPNLE